MSEQLNQIHEMVSQLIQMQAGNNAKIEELSQDLKEFKKEMHAFRDEMYSFRDEMYSFRDEMYAFRKETNTNFRRLERRNEGLERSLDETINRVEELELRN
ncbi:hypothetical protein [Paenibacillus alkalitolerans]|uniref:hypothetical protein n=1 Tax=Paenibacillus alkalitolerans TaxID=2799335 RepID=UPI0018F6FF3B|nr:hypothetical protein [Paenibacillus alkalitolerans]